MKETDDNDDAGGRKEKAWRNTNFVEHNARRNLGSMFKGSNCCVLKTVYLSGSSCFRCLLRSMMVRIRDRLSRAPTMRCMVRYRRIQPHPWLGAAMVWLFAPQLGAWKMDQIYGCLEIYCLKTDSLCQHHNLSKEYLLMLKSEARKKSCNFNNHHSCIGPTIFLEDFEISENRALIANFRKKATES